MNTTIQFQFSGEFRSANVWFEKLKLKMKESAFMMKYAFISGESQSICQYEIIYNTETYQIEGLRENRHYVHYTGWDSKLLVNAKDNELVSLNNNKIIQVWGLHGHILPKQTMATKTSISSGQWYHSKQQTLFITDSHKNIKILNWRRKSIVKRIEKIRYGKSFIIVDNKKQQLKFCNGSKVEVWCLETLVKLKEFDSKVGSSSVICFLDYGKRNFASCGYDTSIRFYNEKFQWLRNIRNAHDEIVLDLLYSFELDLLISRDENLIKCWKLGNFRNNVKVKPYFVIENPFECEIQSITFLNPNKQTQIFVACNTWCFVFDLISKKRTWFDVKIECNNCVLV